jgi:O-antigen/teichoic acid export membrane protein
MSVNRRIISGTVANSAGIGLNAFLQILSVPILASAWGADKFGLWMMLTTIPTYFALTDLGFVQAATSDMTMQVANGHKQRAVNTFQSASVLIFLICAAVVSVVVLGATGANMAGFGGGSIDLALTTTLALFAALSLLSRMPVAALRATGHYALGTLIYDVMTTIEGLASLLTAYLGGGFQDVALCLLLMRLLNMAILYSVLRARVPWLNYGLAHASVAELKRLFRPAIAAMTIPTALAINLQGVVLIIGAVLSPAAVAAYTPVRTCSRLLIQVIGVVNRATMPELAKAFALSDKRQLSHILRINGLMIAGLLIPGSIVFALIGKQFVEFWSAGHISPDRSFVMLVALATVVHGTWYFASNILLATNSHVSFAKYSLAASLATLVLVFVLCRMIGLNGAGVALVIGETLCAIAVTAIFVFQYRHVWNGLTKT